MSQYKKKEHHLRVYKLLAQSIGFIVCSFFMLFIIGEGVPDLLSGKGEELVFFLPLLLFPIIGYVVTWFKEVAGAWMILLGAAGLFVYLIIKHTVPASFIYAVPFAATGLLFLLHIKKRSEFKNSGI